MKPTLEEVQDYFKDAEIVRSCLRSEFTGVSNIHEENDMYWCTAENNSNYCLWKDDNYAKILKTKTMKLEVTEETIKSYHKDACQSFKTRIEKDFPSLFEVELKVGKWYKGTEYHDFLMCLKEDADESNYGFNCIGQWNDRLGMGFRDSLTPATDEEVSTALIAEAKRRGYKKGNHNCLTIFTCYKEVKQDFFFSAGNLWIGQSGKANLIFENGLWAEIVKEEPVYEWQYVYYDSRYQGYAVSHWFYKSKKEFLKLMPNLKPLHKVKESKRIRE